jgi:hypothetical protein
MTPTEIKAAYKASLETLATLTATRDAAEAAYSTACNAWQAEMALNEALKIQVNSCIVAGDI